MPSAINGFIALIFLAANIAIVWLIEMLALRSGFREETSAEMADRRNREWQKEKEAAQAKYAARFRSGSPVVGVDRHGNSFDHRPSYWALHPVINNGERHS